MHNYQCACRFGQLQGMWLHIKDCFVALLRGEVAIVVTIHAEMSTLWQKGAGGGQLREGV